ncbi:MAG: hypothetical protein HZA50_11555 [Planctomycetes bacterium]|nr:hypothetical protein [Planctomycetota bacterium]
MLRLTLMTVILAVAGCQAGESALLLSADAVQASTAEVRKAVNLYDASVAASLDKVKAQLYAAAVREFGGAATRPAGETPEQRAAAMMRVVDDIMLEQERRGQLYRITIDNLRFIDETMAEQKNLIIYSSNVNAQWKSYIQAQARAKPAGERPK